MEAVKSIWFNEVSKMYCLRRECFDSVKYSAMTIVPLLKGWNSANIGEKHLKNENFIY